MAQGGNLSQRITDLIGSGYSTEAAYAGDLINSAINEIADMFGKDYPKKFISKRDGEYDVTLANYSLAKKVLNWEPTRNIYDYIKESI